MGVRGFGLRARRFRPTWMERGAGGKLQGIARGPFRVPVRRLEMGFQGIRRAWGRGTGMTVQVLPLQSSTIRCSILGGSRGISK